MELNSQNINELASALSKAQGKMKAAIKDSTNPHFKSKFSSLNSVWDACREELSKNGLSIIQQIDSASENMVLVTTLLHSSGQWMRSYLPLSNAKQTPQALGSNLSYMRRYGLCSMVGIVSDEDDDGNEASRPVSQQKAAVPVKRIGDAQLVDVVEWIADDSEWEEKILAAYKIKILSDLPEAAYNVIKSRYQERSKCE